MTKLKQIDQPTLDKMIADHKEWVDHHRHDKMLVLSDAKLERLVITGEMDEAVFKNCVFTGCDFSCGSFSDAAFTECSFDKCCFAWADLSTAYFYSCSFILCKMPFANTSGTVFLRCDLSDGGLPKQSIYLDSKLSKEDFMHHAVSLLQMQVDDDEASNAKLALAEALDMYNREVE